jgi:type I restriction enzyme, S subunit
MFDNMIPKKWLTYRLGELLREADVRVQDLGEGTDELEVLSLTKNWGLIPQTDRFDKRIAASDISKYKVVRPNWIVYNPYVIWEGAIHALWRAKSGIVSPVYPVFDRAEDDNGFLDFLLRTPRLIDAYNRLASGAVNRRRSIKKDDFLQIEVTIPPLAEQRAVAQVLRKVQEATRATEQVIAATRQLKQSLMRHLFTCGPVPIEQSGRVELKETEVGSIPKHWDMVRLGNVARVGNGSTPKRTTSAYWDGGTIPWLTSGKVYERIIRRADEFVTEQARTECHLPLVKRDSVVVAITGQGKTLGHAALVAFDTCISQHLAYLQFQDRRVVPEYVLAFLQTRYAHFRQISSGGGSTKGALTCGFLKTYPLPLPPREEQGLVARTLDAVERKLEAEQARVTALHALFQTLLHNLMTGRVRVSPCKEEPMEAADNGV